MIRGVDRKEVTSLGKLDPSTANATVQRYVGGAVCLPSRNRRQTTVNVACGTDRLVDVREPEPCKYELTVELKSACEAVPVAQGQAAEPQAQQEQQPEPHEET